MRIVLSAVGVLVMFVAPNWSQCGTASASSRNGGGVNPTNLSTSQNPILGQNWRLELDCTSVVPPQNGFAILQGRISTTAGVMTRAGEVLLDPRSPRVYRELEISISGITLSPNFPIPPNDASLCGLPISFQGLCAGGTELRLSNAIDIRVGL